MNNETKAINTITSGLVGTSLMTWFSYQVSQHKEQQFREPVLLSTLIDRLRNDPEAGTSNLKGWLIHYGIGTLFSTAYHQLWQKTNMKPTLKNGLWLGSLSGLIGIAAWKMVFHLHPKPPRIDFKRYYAHLLLAHAIFGAAAAMGYRLPEKVLHIQAK
jgi:uncharacterized membrane protein YsdA (DUF1294 family)